MDLNQKDNGHCGRDPAVQQVQSMCCHIVKIFNQLHDDDKPEALDTLQETVIEVATKIRPCITGVQFVLETDPVEEAPALQDIEPAVNAQYAASEATPEIKEDPEPEEPASPWNEVEEDEGSEPSSDADSDYKPHKPILEPGRKRTKSKKRAKKKPADEEKALKKKRDYESKKFKCSKCPYATDEEFIFGVHKICHQKNPKFSCEKCNKTFTAPSTLKRHLMIHAGIKPYQCSQCPKKFIDQASLRSHFVVHTGERAYVCKTCGKAYTNDGNLRRHWRVHTGEMPYKCKLCGVAFRDHSSLKLHHLKHTGEKPYQCPVCNKRFKTSSDYRRHERTHTGEKRYECPKCGKKFAQGYNVTQHLRMHANYRPWQCTLCGKKFRSKFSLNHHERWHAGVKPYECLTCHKKFSTKKYLEFHQVVHTKAQPFKCRICKKPFSQTSNMRRHMKIHSDKIHYKCKFCGRGFKYINSWRYHEGIHTGQHLMCDKCGFQCRSRKTMKMHKCDPKTKHGWDPKIEVVKIETSPGGNEDGARQVISPALQRKEKSKSTPAKVMPRRSRAGKATASISGMEQYKSEIDKVQIGSPVNLGKSLVVRITKEPFDVLMARRNLEAQSENDNNRNREMENQLNRVDPSEEMDTDGSMENKVCTVGSLIMDVQSVEANSETEVDKRSKRKPLTPKKNLPFSRTSSVSDDDVTDEDLYVKEEFIDDIEYLGQVPASSNNQSLSTSDVAVTSKQGALENHVNPTKVFSGSKNDTVKNCANSVQANTDLHVMVQNGGENMANSAGSTGHSAKTQIVVCADVHREPDSIKNVTKKATNDNNYQLEFEENSFAKAVVSNGAIPPCAGE